MTKQTLRNWLIAAGAVGLAALGFFFYNSSTQAADQSLYETESASRGSLVASVGATGTVRAGQTATLTWQTTGRVETVKAVIGQTVKQDETLASLEQTSLPQNIILAEADLVSAQKNLDNVLTSSLALAQAEQSLANALQALDDAQDDVDKLTYRRASDDDIAKTQAEIDLANLEVTRAQENYKRYQNKPDGDSQKAEALLALTQARQNFDNKVATLNWYTSDYSELDAQTYRAAYAVAQAQVEDARREVERLQNGPTPEDVAAAQARVAAAQATLSQAALTAPFDGIVTAAEPQSGDMVKAGQTAFRVDDLSRLLVDLEISEVDINSVAEGQAVRLSFDAVQNKEYNGVVVSVNQAGNAASGAVNFTVTVELTDPDALIRPGMTAAVTITVREVQDALLVPNRAVRVLEGVRVVYVLENGNLLPREIRLGATSDAYSEVVGGELQEGEQIVLNPPAASLQPAPGGGMMNRVR